MNALAPITTASQHAASYLAANNPFDGVVPNFSLFGAQFTSWWQKMLGGLWGIAIIVCAASLITAALKLRSAKTGGYGGGAMEAADDLKKWGISTAIILGAGVIFGGLLAVFS